MFFFNKRSTSPYTDFSDIYVDMHSHLVPGVDDGSHDIADSIEMINGLRSLGFSHLHTTPHSFAERYPNSRESLLKNYSLLDPVIPSEITVKLSSEYYHDDQFAQDLENAALLPMPGNRLLIEFNHISLPLDLVDLLNKVIQKGYQPIIAHPERYQFFINRIDYLEGLKSAGVELQINALSLTDYYGKSIQVFAEKLIDAKLIDFIGTDIHNAKQLDDLSQVPGKTHYAKLLDSGLLKNSELA